MTGHRPRIDRFQLCAALLAGLASLLVSGAVLAADGKGQKPAWPQHVQVTESRLALKDVQGTVQLALPQFRAYGRDGRQLYAASGYEPAGFKEAMTGLLTAPEKRPAAGKPPDPDTPKTLAADLAKLESPDGKALPKLPAADLTLIKYWADWCVPCHAQSRDLAALLAAHPGVKIHLVHVDADLTKWFPKKAG
jgi:thiol-disulfide isomerase/thioredoxin